MKIEERKIETFKNKYEKKFSIKYLDTYKIYPFYYDFIYSFNKIFTSLISILRFYWVVKPQALID